MKILRILSLALGIVLSLNVMAQKPLSENAQKAQKALLEQLVTKGITPSLDPKDNSVNFKVNNVFYWVTFEGDSPVLYTIHRKGINFEKDPAFKSFCAAEAANAVNIKAPIKCTVVGKRVEFTLQTYSTNPYDFNSGVLKMIDGFNNVDDIFKKSYEACFDKWKQDSIDSKKPIIPDNPIATSPLKVSGIAFANVDNGNYIISDFNQPLRQNDMQYLSTSVNVESPEKGIYKLGMKIINPDGTEMIATKNMDYAATSNVEIKKANKAQPAYFNTFGSNSQGFWKPGEYKVEIEDFENGAKLYTTTFNIL